MAEQLQNTLETPTTPETPEPSNVSRETLTPEPSNVSRETLEAQNAVWKEQYEILKQDNAQLRQQVTDLTKSNLAYALTGGGKPEQTAEEMICEMMKGRY